MSERDRVMARLLGIVEGEDDKLAAVAAGIWLRYDQSTSPANEAEPPSAIGYVVFDPVKARRDRESRGE